MIYAFIGMIVLLPFISSCPVSRATSRLRWQYGCVGRVYLLCECRVLLNYDEVRIPAKVTGTAAGLISLLPISRKSTATRWWAIWSTANRYCRLSGCFPVHVGLRIHRPIAALVLQRVNRKSKNQVNEILKTMRIAHPESDGGTNGGHVNESARQTPVIAQTDVLVIGAVRQDYPQPLRQGG